MSDHKLFSDKYQVTSFDNIIYNEYPAQQLMACSRLDNIPHIIISGREGSGRKTFANLYIQSKYHLTNLPIRHQFVDIKNGTKSIELQLLYSDYHYQIDPSIHGVYDRLIVQGFVKDILQTKPISHIPYHIIIINNADRLTVEAQQSLRRTLEKNIGNCRFIFIITQETTLIDALVSRCIQIRIGSPTIENITTKLSTICQQENVPFKVSQIRQIAEYAERDMTRALNILQYMILKYGKQLISDTSINFIDIDVNSYYLDQLCQQLMRSKCPDDVLEMRKMLYELMVQCMDPIKIMKYVFYYFKKHMKPGKEHQLVQIIVKYENTMKLGSKPIYHLEAMLVSIMNLLKL